MTRRSAAAVLLAALTLLTACGGGDSPSPSPSSSPTSASPTATPTTAVAAPRPPDRACYALSYDAAVAPTSSAKPVDCGAAHTSITFKVGTLDTVVDGHLLAVDSHRVQAQVASDCPAALPKFLGATSDQLHLSMLRAVWFTPTVEQSDAGADWYRCDVIAVAADGRLAPLTGKIGGVLAKPDARQRFGMCGTAEPGTPDFHRVICSGSHSWKAVSTVPIAGRRYPGEATAREAGQQQCEDAGREAASDKLDFKWGYEWPTAQQWEAGQHYGLCWVPD
ncbi:MAG: septum formation family protein [Nocardioides sp.]